MGVDFTVFKGSANGDIVEAKGHRETGPTEVIVNITHCGVCGTDEHYRHADQGLGHEGIGIVTEIGSAVPYVSDVKVGDRVGVSWFHKFCGYCQSCVDGHQNNCSNATFFGTADHDQGCFSSAVAWDVSTVFKIPDGIASEDAGPLMCGGATVWSPLFNGGYKAGDRIGIIGVGGLGHLAIQFAAKMGLEPIVFSSTESKRQDALALGASEFHVTASNKFEGVGKVDGLLITANTNPDLAQYIPILAARAKVFVLTVSFEPLQVVPLHLIMTSANITGSGIASVGSMRSMLRFAAKHGVKPQIEKFPMTQAGITEAMEKLRNGKMRYRGVVVAQ